MSTTFISDRKEVRIVKNVSFQLKRGHALAVVGESGCGKSVTSLSIMRLVARALMDLQADAVPQAPQRVIVKPLPQKHRPVRILHRFGQHARRDRRDRAANRLELVAETVRRLGITRLVLESCMTVDEYFPLQENSISMLPRLPGGSATPHPK